MFREYTIGVLRWWYGIYVPGAANKLIDRLLFILQYTGTLPMAQNITKPLYQDNSGVGKMVAVIIRGTWVWLGGMFSIVLLLPSLLTFLFQVLAPFVIMTLAVVLLV